MSLLVITNSHNFFITETLTAVRGIFSVIAIMTLWRLLQTKSKSIVLETAHSDFK